MLSICISILCQQALNIFEDHPIDVLLQSEDHSSVTIHFPLVLLDDSLLNSNLVTKDQSVPFASIPILAFVNERSGAHEGTCEALPPVQRRYTSNRISMKEKLFVTPRKMNKRLSPARKK
ncbi:hypothetical protein K0M31_009377 [Melipona bicolor]|uniref:Uncharacterized protein n=1 Tax=Melipona bicolor TaxID=60889 RepID=A0AA40KJ85_9HYME|nr:hypothetical protein K0M31_009377 [Melipona bicolor]